VTNTGIARRIAATFESDWSHGIKSQAKKGL
jgi:hypothetical protein